MIKIKVVGLLFNCCFMGKVGRPKLVSGFKAAELGLNPFVRELIILANEVVEEKHLFEARSYTDNVFVTAGEKRKLNFILEKQAYTKIYVSASFRKQVAGLKNCTKSLFLWLSYEIKPSKDYIVLNVDRYKKESDVTHNTMMVGIIELINNSIIGKTKFDNVYWINPAYFFSGNRMRKYPSSVITTMSKNA